MAERTPTPIDAEDLVDRQATWAVLALGAGDFADFDQPAFGKVWFAAATITAGAFVSGDLQLTDISNPANAQSFPDSIDGQYHAPTAAALMGHLNNPTKGLRLTNNGTSTIDALVIFLR